MALQTVPKIQIPPYDSPPRVNHVHSDASYQSDALEQARLAVLLDLGLCIPMISFEQFLEYIAPPQPEFDLRTTMQSLKSGRNPTLTHSNRWSSFVEDPKDSKIVEDRAFRPMPEIFTEVVAAIFASSRGRLSEENRTIDFLQNPRRAPTSTERRNESRPDGYFVLKHRNKVMSEDKTREIIHWADVALSCEYKVKDGRDELEDVRIHQGF